MGCRCVNDLFAYCVDGEVNIKGLKLIEYPDGTFAYEGSGTCREKLPRCRYHLTNLQYQQHLDLTHGYKSPKAEAEARKGKK